MNPIVEMRFGSHLYGTATSRSDFDLKTVYLPEAHHILLQRVRPTVSFSPVNRRGYTSHILGLPISSPVLRESDEIGFVRQLCTALAHRWEPERLFVILTAYFDESGTHGGNGTPENPASRTIVMAGMMGTAAQWVRFEAAYSNLRRTYGFDVLHMLDFKKVQKKFAGWDDHKRVAFLRDFGAIIEAGQLMEGVTFRLDREDYRFQYIADRPRKPRLDTEYGLCFRNCLLHLLVEAERRLGHDARWDKTKLHVVLESGHEHGGDAIRVFNESKDEFAKAGNNTLATITFAGKKECAPLAVGDFLAYVTWSLDQVHRSSGAPAEQFFGHGVNRRSNITHIRFQEKGLTNIRARLIRNRGHGRVPIPSNVVASEGLKE